MQNQTNTQGPERSQTQLNIAIDSSLHQALRIQAVMRKQSLREYSEALLRSGIEHDVSHEGQPNAPSSRLPVNETA